MSADAHTQVKIVEGELILLDTVVHLLFVAKQKGLL